MAFHFPTTAAEFPFEGEVTEVLSDESVQNALEHLRERFVLSLPVFDKDRKEYIGWFTISDLLPIFLALDSHIKSLPTEELTPLNATKAAKQFPITLHGSNFDIGSQSTVNFCFEKTISPHFPWRAETPNTPMGDVIKCLSEGNVKRIPILDDEGRVTKIISQNAIMKFVSEQVIEFKRAHDAAEDGAHLPDMFEKTAADLGFLKDVVVVNESDPVARAVELMIETKHSAIGVVDEDGDMVTCITTKDLLSFESLEALAQNRQKVEREVRAYEDQASAAGATDVGAVAEASRALADKSVMDYIAYVRRQRAGKAKFPLIAIHPDETLFRIISRMTLSRVHTVFIRDYDRKPVGVVSVRDVIKQLFP